MAIRSILPLTVSGPVTVAHPGSWQTGDTASLYVGDNNSGLTSTFGGPVNVFGYNGVNIAVQKQPSCLPIPAALQLSAKEVMVRRDSY